MDEEEVFDENASKRTKSYNFGQYQKQVSLLSGISLDALYRAISSTGINVEMKDTGTDGYILNCDIGGLSFSISVIGFDGDDILEETELGMAIQCIAFFKPDKFENELAILKTVNNWNEDEAFSKSYYSDNVIVLEMIIPAAGVVDDNVNDGIHAWLDICTDFVKFLADAEG